MSWFIARLASGEQRRDRTGGFAGVMSLIVSRALGDVCRSGGHVAATDTMMGESFSNQTGGGN